MHTSPDGLVALAAKVSLSPVLGRTIRASKDPLGAFVTRVIRETREPFWEITTFQRTPLRFWSTSNSTDDGDEVRRTGTCSGSSTIELRLRSDDDEIRVELEIGGSRPGSAWKVILLHERRIAYRGTLRSTSGGRARLRRELPDWYGSDAVTVRATGPRSQSCRVSATLR